MSQDKTTPFELLLTVSSLIFALSLILSLFLPLPLTRSTIMWSMQYKFDGEKEVVIKGDSASLSRVGTASFATADFYPSVSNVSKNKKRRKRRKRRKRSKRRKRRKEEKKKVIYNE